MAQEIAQNHPIVPAESVPAPVAGDHAVHTAHGVHDEKAAKRHRLLGIENRKFAVWLFICSEVIFFTVLIAANAVARWRDPGPHETLNIQLTALNTFILLTSSYTVVLALSGIQTNNRTKFLRNLVLSMVFGGIFVGIQAFEYTNLSHEGFVLSSNLFTNTFFALTGFHGTHVIIGLVWLGRLFVRGFNGKYSAEQHEEIELAGLYWHFVDVIWIILFVVVYLI
jgi:heme/copper-type cytochrome/quinol oxidase subunit 3